MCGIAGYVGKEPAKYYLMEGLKKLEYRGYDSAGIASVENKEISITKVKGRLEELIKKADNAIHKGSVGIGHTRWATHGRPDESNSHPHISQNGKFAVVHNGIIENYSQLKDMLEEKGYKFFSETDTEVIPNLIQYFYTGDLFDAFSKAVSCLKGSYALGMISSYEPDKIFAVSKENPLIVGIGDGENYIASDVPALLNKTCKVYLMNDNEFAILTKDRVLLLDYNKQPISKTVTEIASEETDTEKDGYEFFMLKEIMEQPKAVANTILPRIADGQVHLRELNLIDAYLKSLNKIFIVGCGSAYHAGMVGKSIIEKLTRVQVCVELASEFRYNNPVICPEDLVVVISQSGETSDTLAALKYAKSKGSKIISIVNVKESSIARESENVIYTHAGPEIAVATTKAYLTQTMVLYLLALHISKVKNTISDSEHKELVGQMAKTPGLIEKLLSESETINKLSKEFLNCNNMFFIGRGVDSYIAMEGALKLKEISYIHSESYAAGELKHGTLSLIEEGTPVIALCTQKNLYKKMLGNIKEVKARGGTVVVIKTKDMEELDSVADKVLRIPADSEYFSGILSIIYLQLFAYYVSYNKGLDVDKPRNLAKSVTVE